MKTIIGMILKLFNSIRAFFVKPVSGDFIRNLDLMQRIYTEKWNLPVGMLDAKYYYTDRAGWAEIISDIVFNSPLFQTDKFDCDNFAFRAMSLCAERHGINACGVAIGASPFGRHAWNVIYDGEGFVFFEPQTGEFIEIDGDYHADDIII